MFLSIRDRHAAAKHRYIHSESLFLLAHVYARHSLAYLSIYRFFV